MAVRLSFRFLPVAFGFVSVAAPASAQIPDKFENLQVLPKEITRPELTAIMRGFTQALGVRCEFCHVPRDAQPGAAPAGGGGGGAGLNLKFASDERDNKKTARLMLRMVDSAIIRYRALRNDMASGKYSFGEQPVSDVAQRLSTQGQHDDAIKLLQMNQEFYPNSVNIDFQLAETYIAKGDRDAGIARLRAMLTKNPNDRRAQARLQQLGVLP